MLTQEEAKTLHAVSIETRTLYSAFLEQMQNYKSKKSISEIELLLSMLEFHLNINSLIRDLDKYTQEKYPDH